MRPHRGAGHVSEPSGSCLLEAPRASATWIHAVLGAGPASERHYYGHPDPTHHLPSCRPDPLLSQARQVGPARERHHHSQAQRTSQGAAAGGAGSAAGALQVRAGRGGGTQSPEWGGWRVLGGALSGGRQRIAAVQSQRCRVSCVDQQASCLWQPLTTYLTPPHPYRPSGRSSGRRRRPRC